MSNYFLAGKIKILVQFFQHFFFFCTDKFLRRKYNKSNHFAVKWATATFFIFSWGAILTKGPSINDVTHLGGGGSAKIWCYSISLFSKMGVKWEGGVKNLTKLVTSLIDGPLDQIIKCVRVSKHHQIKIHENALFFRGKKMCTFGF